jgi:hypothetical protein
VFDSKESEAKILDLVRGNADLLVLARYMQVISEDFIDKVGIPIINIHHSFLPAFIGAGPYRKAKERGVDPEDLRRLFERTGDRAFLELDRNASRCGIRCHALSARGVGHFCLRW